MRGTVAMARTVDPDSATAQFFINQRTNLSLDWIPGRPGYTVFGKVIDGMDIVDLIALSETGAAKALTMHGQMLFQNVPANPITILSISRIAP